MKPKIGIITLGVRDFAKSLAFYRDGLGFTPYNFTEGEEHVMFRMEGAWLSLYPRQHLAEDATVPDAVDNAFAAAIVAGAKAIKQPQKVFWGGYSGYFADPDGYLWEGRV